MTLGGRTRDGFHGSTLIARHLCNLAVLGHDQGPGMIVASEIGQITCRNFPARAPGAILIDHVEENDAVVDPRFFLGHDVRFSFVAGQEVSIARQLGMLR